VASNNLNAGLDPDAERALEELGRELIERPAWVEVPLRLILRLVSEPRP
jgi:predicted trehalose synthase